MKENERHWYITIIAGLYLVLCSIIAGLYLVLCSIIAGLYLVLCSISVVRYALVDLRSDAGTVPVAVQVLCLGMALAAGAYFLKPRVGHKGLIFFTAGTLVAIGTSDPGATCFHLVVLCLLSLPYVQSSMQTNSRSGPDNRDQTSIGRAV